MKLSSNAQKYPFYELQKKGDSFSYIYPADIPQAEKDRCVKRIKAAFSAYKKNHPELAGLKLKYLGEFPDAGSGLTKGTFYLKEYIKKSLTDNIPWENLKKAGDSFTLRIDKTAELKVRASIFQKFKARAASQEIKGSPNPLYGFSVSVAKEKADIPVETDTEITLRVTVHSPETKKQKPKCVIDVKKVMVTLKDVGDTVIIPTHGKDNEKPIRAALSQFFNRRNAKAINKDGTLNRLYGKKLSVSVLVTSLGTRSFVVRIINPKKENPKLTAARQEIDKLLDSLTKPGDKAVYTNPDKLPYKQVVSLACNRFNRKKNLIKDNPSNHLFGLRIQTRHSEGQYIFRLVKQNKEPV